MTIQHSSAETRWRTPPHIVEMVRKVLGGIDLDPASDIGANQIVKAERILTAEDNALECGWSCAGQSIYLNPPGGKTNGCSNAALFWGKLMRERKYSGFNHAIFLGFNLGILRSAQTKAFSSPLDFPLCVPRQRIRFVHPDGRFAKSPSHDNVIIYVPGSVNKSARFVNVFTQLGGCKE